MSAECTAARMSLCCVHAPLRWAGEKPASCWRDSIRVCSLHRGVGGLLFQAYTRYRPLCQHLGFMAHLDDQIDWVCSGFCCRAALWTCLKAHFSDSQVQAGWTCAFVVACMPFMPTSILKHESALLLCTEECKWLHTLSLWGTLLRAAQIYTPAVCRHRLHTVGVVPC